MVAGEAVVAKKDLSKFRNDAKSHDLQRFFQTGPGQYGEGDLFLGVSVPQIRMVAKIHSEMPLVEVEKLLESKYHEERFCALVILTNQFKSSENKMYRKRIYDFYVQKIKSGRVNNWDLIDVPGSQIAGHLLTIDNPLEVLRKYAKSKNLWLRRAAIIFTFPFIREGDMNITLAISKDLLKDSHDLIHKATGWALREVGKKDIVVLRSFLHNHAKDMPRTMLRYAIEKLPTQERKRWLLLSKDG